MDMNEDEKEYIFSQKDNNNSKSASKKAKDKKIFTRNKSMFQPRYGKIESSNE